MAARLYVLLTLVAVTIATSVNGAGAHGVPSKQSVMRIAIATSNQLPDSLRLHVGQRLLLYRAPDNGPFLVEFPSDPDVALLADLAAVRKWAKSDDRNEIGGVSHVDAPPGATVTVSDWTVVRSPKGDEIPMVFVSTVQAPIVKGWIEDEWLMPILATGTPVLVSDHIFYKRHFRRDSPNAGHSIAFYTPATLLSQDLTSESGPYFVQIASGPLKGQRGYANLIETALASNAIKSRYYETYCKCVNLWPATNEK